MKNMNNQEKATEIGGNARKQQYFDPRCNDLAGNIGFMSAMVMAEWKDQQYTDIIKEESNASYESGLAAGERKAEVRFKEYLEKKTEPFIRTNGSPQGTYQEGFDDGYTSAIDEIINELFKEE